MNKYIYFFICLFFFVACQDDDTEIKICEVSPPLPNCEYTFGDFTTPAVNKDSTVNFINCLGGQENYINVENYNYYYPCFNPNDANEIAYMRQNNNEWTGCNFEIWVFNFCTGGARFVTAGICYSIDWSVKDWIVFTGENRQLWKVKPSGDSLVQITNNGTYNNFAMWNRLGSKLAFGSPFAGDPFLIADENGVTLDTISEMKLGAYWHWSPTDEGFSCMTGSASEEIMPTYFDLTDRQFRELPTVDATQHGYIQDTDWIGDDKIVWLGIWSVGTTDINTQEVNQIAVGYQNRFYHNLAVSPDGKSIVTEREDFFQTGFCDVETRRNLYIMEADGSNEWKINIPE